MPLHVFVSGTFDDLAEHRQEVHAVLRRLREVHSSMEFWGASDKDATELSLEELDRCNVYLGIIGHRYGSLTPDGRTSITEAEYLRARERWQDEKMRLLIYLADDNVPVPPKLIGPDEMRQRQAGFRQSLRIHKPVLFRDAADLAQWVAADIGKLRVQGLPELPGPRVFDHDELPVIIANFDQGGERLRKVRDFMRFVADTFKPLFNLDPVRPKDHPFIEQVNQKLDSIIPGVVLDADGGKLTRTEIEHILLRARTMVALLKSIPPENLRRVAQGIGREAAEDLIKNTVRAPEGLIPGTDTALVSLWAYWDRTGGWGKISLVESEDEADEAESGGTRSAPEWRLRIDNNFLGYATDSVEEANSLADFWAGYIHGFLNFALPEIARVVQDLDWERQSKVALPPYDRISTVVHIPDADAKQDTFVVTFEQQSLSESRQAVNQSREEIRKADRQQNPESARALYLKAIAWCRMAIVSARDELGAETFTGRFARIGLTEGQVQLIMELLEKKARPPSRQVAEEYYDACNLLIQRLSAAVETP